MCVVQTALTIVNDTIGRYVVYLNMSSWTYVVVNICRRELISKRLWVDSETIVSNVIFVDFLVVESYLFDSCSFDVFQYDRSNANPYKKIRWWHRCMIVVSDVERKKKIQNYCIKFTAPWRISYIFSYLLTDRHQIWTLQFLHITKYLSISHFLPNSISYLL